MLVQFQSSAHSGVAAAARRQTQLRMFFISLLLPDQSPSELDNVRRSGREIDRWIRAVGLHSWPDECDARRKRVDGRNGNGQARSIRACGRPSVVIVQT